MHRPDRLSGEMTAGGERVVGADRVLAVLAELGARPAGVTLDEMARLVRSPKATVHRALGTLCRAGFANQDSRGHYILGDELLRMAFAHHEARPEHVRVRPALEKLVERFSETAHYAVLDGRSVVYRAKVDPTVGAVRLTSTIGGRNPAHCTGVGKALLAWRLPDLAAVEAWIGGEQLARKTPNTAMTAGELASQLARTRELGFAVDDQENEIGINCVAVPVFLGPSRQPSGAISVSAVAYRTPLPALLDAIADVQAIAGEINVLHGMTA
jgi:IclR family acetate operon transcriptional repressor